jgi:GT2 family glycosyltransferase/glycosyltransferase involved in cell wall biosynthesis
MIHIIIPVYKGLAETKRCLESALRAGNGQQHRITVIDDCSPDPELKDYLVALSQNGAVELLRNEQNLGFVATVNRGMGLDPDADVVLLNSDTEVAGDWLDRLHHCAYGAPDIGTVTPFSNNATICSYPKFCEDNPLPEEWDVARLDALSRRINTGKSIEIPTAVGFCMYIKRACLNETGLFDVGAFGKGYGEENDFCMRARKRGWRHMLCADTFVYHAGGVSFAETQNARKQAAQRVLNHRHPSYPRLVRRHVKQDPARPLRQAMDFMRLCSGGRQVILFVTHNLGGGTERHVQELSEFLAQDAEVLVLRPHYWGEVVLVWQKEGEAFRLFFQLDEDYPALLRFFQLAGVPRVHFHHLIGHSPRVRNIALDLGIPFDVTLHDYHQICPRTSLTSVNHRYCGEPDELGCNACLQSSPYAGTKNIREWRSGNIQWLNKAQRVFVPTEDTARRIRRYAPGTNVVIAPHPDLPNAETLPIPAPPSLKKQEALRIVVLGALSPIKGPEILERCALLAQRAGQPLRFHLIGHAYRDLKTEPATALTIHGPYKDNELPDLIAQSRPHLIWFPVQGPETYSYTLSAALRAGLPVAVPNIGAFAERVANRPLTWVCPWQWKPEEWNAFFMELRACNLNMESPIANSSPPAPSRERFRYEDYLLPATSRPSIQEKDYPEIHALLETHSRRRMPFAGRLILDLRSLLYPPRLRSWVGRHPGIVPAARKILAIFRGN